MNLKQRNGKLLQAMLNFKIQHVFVSPIISYYA